MEEYALHRPLPSESFLPSGLLDERINEFDATGLPCCYHPDGLFSFELSAFFLNCWRNQKLSLFNRGGSARQYAHQLHELVRFLERNHLNVLTITDSRFEGFIRGLSVPEDQYGEPTKNANTIRAIGSKSLEFLNFITTVYGREGYVGQSGIIRGYETSGLDKKSGKYARVGWYHPCFPLPSTEGRRNPISPNNIAAIREVIRGKKNKRVRHRQDVLISILEHTGCRRGEAAGITVADVMVAYRSTDKRPMLRIPNIKGVNEHRFVPVTKPMLWSLQDYISTTRAKLVRRLKETHGEIDHGIVLVNSYTGRALNINTITNDINDLKFAAGITGSAHAHMFRHRFITEKFKELIVEYDLENTDVMRRAIANSELIKEMLQEWTGHKRKESLDRYIHIAFRELARMENVVTNVMRVSKIKEAALLMERLEKDMLAMVITEKEYMLKCRELLSSTVDASIN